MIKDTNKTASSKQFSDVQIEEIYQSSKVRAYKVSIKEGIFTVVDYQDRFSKNPDTEIYYTRYNDPVSPNSKEYKAANQVVTNYILSLRKVTDLISPGVKDK